MDIVVTASVFRSDFGSSLLGHYYLSTFSPSAEKTAFQLLKEQVLKDTIVGLNWLGVSITMNGMALVTTKGTREWFQQIEAFKTYGSGGGGETFDHPMAYGVVDRYRRSRISVEGGTVIILNYEE